MTDRPIRTLVLAGGGHAHVIVLRALGDRPAPGLRVIVVAKELSAPYSGMLPGLVAGIYTPEQCHIDVPALAAWAGAETAHDAVTGVDAAARRVSLASGGQLDYDLLSLDIGVTPALDALPGAAEHGVAVKPVSAFHPKWEALAEAAGRPDGPRRFAVIGGGAAGFELALAIRRRLRDDARRARRDPEAFAVTLVAGDELLPGMNAGARRRARRALADARVALIERDPAAEIAPDGARLASGRRVAADAALVTTRAAAAPWFAASGLPTAPDGFLAARPTLQLEGLDDVFAVGDCATVTDHPRPKAGVFAVRQGPPLAENLRRAARGAVPRPFEPQRRWLSILSKSDGTAIAARGRFAAEGAWVWRWKDHIDRRFMARFRDLPPR
mgnify:CR=1 FL=1